MPKENINLFITPQVAASLVKLYYQLKANPQAESSDVADLNLRLKEISEFNHWKFEEVQQIVDHLAFLAATANEQDRTAAVPPNLEQLVKEYLEYEKKLAQPRINQEELNRTKNEIEKHKALLAKLSPQQILQEEKIIVLSGSGSVYEQSKNSVAVLEPEEKVTVKEADTVREIPTTRYIPPRSTPKEETKDGQEQEALEPKREQIQNWVEQAKRAALIQKALLKAQVPEKYAGAISQRVEYQLNTGQISEDKFLTTVSDVISKIDSEDKTLLTPQSEEVVNTIKGQAKEAYQEIHSITQNQFTEGQQAQNAPFDLSQPIQRPQNRPKFTTPPKDEDKSGQTYDEERKEKQQKIEANNLVLVLYKRTPFWKDPARIFYSNRPDARKYVLAQIRSSLLSNPETYSENFILLQTIEANIDNILPLLPNGKLEQLDAVRMQDALHTIEQYGAVGTQALEVQVDAKNNEVLSQKISVNEATKIASMMHNGLYTPKEAEKHLETLTKAVKQTTTKAQRDLLSNAAIKLRNLYTNPELGNLRAYLGIILGLGALVAPGPLALKVGIFAVGGSLGISQIAQSPKAVSAGVVGASKILPGIQEFARLLSFFKFQPVKMSGWIMGLCIGLPVALFFLTTNSISNTQSIFLKEQLTSAPSSPQSQYIVVEKEVTPTSSTTLPVEARFTITIAAKDKNLKDITVNDIFSVTGKNSAPTPSIPQGITFPTSLNAGETRSISFSINLTDPNYMDSIVINNVTVKANVEGGPQGESASGSAAITIGKPPTGCFIFEGSWPEEYKTKAESSFAVLSRYPTYLANICKDSSFGPNIHVRFGGSNTYGGEVNGGNVMTLYDRAFDSRGITCTVYTLTHESGHVLANKNPEILANFLKTVNPPSGEAYIPSYTLGFKPSEDFAESIAMYIKYNIGDFGCSGSYTSGVQNMPNVSPIHYNFWTQYIK